MGHQSQRETLGTKLEKDWPVRKHLTVGEKNIINEPLVDRQKIIFPPLHIKLGLMKQFVKALDTDGNCFKYLCESFPALSYEKIEAGVFDGPQIRQPMKDNTFPNSMNETERQACLSFVSVVENFLWNTFFSSILILYKGYAYIFGELLIVLVLILIVITYIESQYMAKNISAHCKKKLDLIEKKLMTYLESATPKLP